MIRIKKIKYNDSNKKENELLRSASYINLSKLNVKKNTDEIFKNNSFYLLTDKEKKSLRNLFGFNEEYYSFNKKLNIINKRHTNVEKRLNLEIKDLNQNMKKKDNKIADLNEKLKKKDRIINIQKIKLKKEVSN